MLPSFDYPVEKTFNLEGCLTAKLQVSEAGFAEKGRKFGLWKFGKFRYCPDEIPRDSSSNSALTLNNTRIVLNKTIRTESELMPKNPLSWLSLPALLTIMAYIGCQPKDIQRIQQEITRQAWQQMQQQAQNGLADPRLNNTFGNGSNTGGVAPIYPPTSQTNPQAGYYTNAPYSTAPTIPNSYNPGYQPSYVPAGYAPAQPPAGISLSAIFLVIKHPGIKTRRPQCDQLFAKFPLMTEV